MSFFDRVGQAYTALTSVGVAPDIGAAVEGFKQIGNAYTAANNNEYGHAVFAALQHSMDPLNMPGTGQLNPQKLVPEALSAGYSYGLARPVSTLDQQSYNLIYGPNSRLNFFSPDSWEKAWNRSEEISPGQAATTFAKRGSALWLGTADDPFHGQDPFSDDYAPRRDQMFKDSWSGKLISGGVDALLGSAIDPAVIGAKFAKAAELSRSVLKTGEIEDTLSRTKWALSGDPAAEVQSRKGKTLAKLVDKIYDTPLHSTPALPELAHTHDAGALAYLFNRAKEINPKQPAYAKQAIVDILGATWGNPDSIDSLIGRQTQLAVELERLSNVPVPAAADEMSFNATGQGVIEFFDKKAQRGILSKKDAIQGELDRLNEILLAPAVDEPRIIGSVPDKMASNRTHNNINQSFLESYGSAPIRIVTQQTARRTPGSVDIKHTTSGYQDMADILGQMSHTSVDNKQKIMNNFLKAGNSDERGNIVTQMYMQDVRDAAKNYGIKPETAEKIINAGEGRMSELRSSLSTRLYSAAGDDPSAQQYVSLHDPEDDITDVFHHPFLQSHLEDRKPVLNPHDVDKIFKAHQGNSVLDQMGMGAAATEIGLMADQMAKGFTSLWKTAALARGAYPLRIQTDSQLRLLVHMETMQFMGSLASRAGAGAKYRTKWLIGKREKGGPLSEMFPQGRYRASLMASLKQSTVDGRFDFSDQDLEEVANYITATNGSAADMATELSERTLRKIRSGDWGITDPSSPQWISDYQRAVNQQISNSPTAVALLANDSIPLMLARLKKEMKTGGPIAKEWRSIGKSFRDDGKWLATVIKNNNHYLPTPELRSWIIPSDGADTGKHINEQMIRSKFHGVNPKVKPMPVHGEAFSVEQTGAIQARYHKLQEGFFRFAADMPETTAARAPLFMYSYRRRTAETLERLGDQDLGPQQIDAIRKANMSLARRDMGRILYNAADASNLSRTMRYLSPFFTAWEDTMTKWGKLIYDSPELIPRANHLSLNSTGMVQDQNGNTVDRKGHVFTPEGKLITDPSYQGGGEFILLPRKLTDWVPLLGEGQVKIRKNSINSVFQGDPWWLPGFGPVVQVPLNHIIRQSFPEAVDNPLIKYALPYGTTTDSVKSQLLPKWLKTGVNIFGSTQDFANQNAIFLAQATIDYQHGGPPVDINKIHNKTRNYFILKAAMDNASPVSIQPDAKYQLYIDKAHAYKADPNRKDWQKDFFDDFPGYFDLSMSLSANNTGIVASNSAMDASQKYRKDIQANPELGWLYVGPANAGAFSGGVYDWQQTNSAGKGLNFRGKKDPVVALQQANAEEGWQQWNSFRTAINLELEKRGLFSTQQTGAEDLHYAQQEYEKFLGGKNADWLKSKQTTGAPGKAGNMIDAAQAFMDKHPDVKTRPDMVALSQYVEMREAVKLALIQRPNSSLQYNPDLKAALDAYGAQLAAENIGFEQMWNRTLSFDDLTDIDIHKADQPKAAHA